MQRHKRGCAEFEKGPYTTYDLPTSPDGQIQPCRCAFHDSPMKRPPQYTNPLFLSDWADDVALLGRSDTVLTRRPDLIVQVVFPFMSMQNHLLPVYVPVIPG